jgi:hypothetical protein
MTSSMRSRIRTTATLVLVCAGAACTQKPVTSSFVAMLGPKDTIGVESYSRWADSLAGTNVAAYPRAMVRSYSVHFGPGGEVSHIHLTSGAPGAETVTATDFSYTGDSVVVQTRRDTLTRRYAVAAGGERPLPFFEDLFAFWGIALEGVHSSATDSTTLGMLWGPQVQPVTVKRMGATEEEFGFPEWGMANATFGTDGLLDHLDMTQTTSKYTVTRVPSVNTEATATAWGARPQQPGALSPRDSASAEVGGAHVVIDYGRPSARGRTVYGGLIPFNAVWRTGANAATQLVIDRDLVIGGTPIPAGTYSLWTEATESDWTLVVNKQHGQWGTEHDATQDFARIPLTVSKLTEPVEQFTITVTPAGPQAGTITLAWGDTQGTVSFTVR